MLLLKISCPVTEKSSIFHFISPDRFLPPHPMKLWRKIFWRKSLLLCGELWLFWVPTVEQRWLWQFVEDGIVINSSNVDIRRQNMNFVYVLVNCKTLRIWPIPCLQNRSKTQNQVCPLTRFFQVSLWLMDLPVPVPKIYIYLSTFAWVGQVDYVFC